ncbi:Lateral signaling target protein 2-like protein [Psilocybe cubensis]|nr:Lateral signaling target protein 2-like protein [Psilocybe cubensis]KAH9487183.1 Lateral signaling target protein 2-like protein [Psilocybe cubensis]
MRPSDLPALEQSTDSASSSSSSLLDVPIHSPVDRPNQHLAVLLQKHLWKPDSSTNTCDNFYCRVPFSLFERKHHCRKCGGIFCGACTSRTTPLLDTSNLSFLQPPRNVPLTAFESPISPILDSRVCDDCWDQIHGCPTTPHTPEVTRPSFKRALSNPMSILSFPRSPASPASTSSAAERSSSVSPPDGFVAPSFKRKTAMSLQQTPSTSSLNSSSSSNNSQGDAPVRSSLSRRVSCRASQRPLPQDLERSYGELDAYPLRRSSVLCKASGGGRWEPKQSPVLAGYRIPIPGGKAPFETMMEQEEQLERLRKQNPIVKDGAFQYRFPKEPEPVVLSRSPFNLSTF